jgi:intracellular proteinase inhibitor BsuPI
MRALLIIVLVIELCDVPAMPGPTASVGVRGLQVELRLNKAAFRAGEAVEITLALTNSSGPAVEVQFPTGQMYDFVVTREGRLVWQWSFGRAFTQAFTMLTLMPKESKAFDERWDQRNYQGQQATPGEYEMVAVFPAGGARFMPNRPDGPKLRFSIMDRSVPSIQQHIASVTGRKKTVNGSIDSSSSSRSLP